MKYQDLTGKKFTRLTAIRIIGKRGSSFLWECMCDCGALHSVSTGQLNSQNTRSCGCLQRDMARDINFKHGYRRKLVEKESPTYASWRGMTERCKNINHKNYELYKDRPVCLRWHKFENFLVDMGERPVGTSLDRKDNSKGYTKNNCRWATSREQHRNHSRNVSVVYKGREQCLKDWCEELGINYGSTVGRKCRLGCTGEEALLHFVARMAEAKIGKTWAQAK